MPEGWDSGDPRVADAADRLDLATGDGNAREDDALFSRIAASIEWSAPEEPAVASTSSDHQDVQVDPDPAEGHRSVHWVRWAAMAIATMPSAGL